MNIILLGSDTNRILILKCMYKHLRKLQGISCTVWQWWQAMHSIRSNLMQTWKCWPGAVNLMLSPSLPVMRSGALWTAARCWLQEDDKRCKKWALTHYITGQTAGLMSQLLKWTKVLNFAFAALGIAFKYQCFIICLLCLIQKHKVPFSVTTLTQSLVSVS